MAYFCQQTKYIEYFDHIDNLKSVRTYLTGGWYINSDYLICLIKKIIYHANMINEIKWNEIFCLYEAKLLNQISRVCFR